MIKRNDQIDIPVETDNDKARISIKKGLLMVGCCVATVICAISFRDYHVGAQARAAERQTVIDAMNALEMPYWRQPSSGFGADTVADMALAGMDVAKLQNAYFGSDDGDILEIQNQLRSYFTDSSGEFIWFYPGPDADTLIWRYETGSGIESCAERGIWTLSDFNSRLCAYAVADYDTKTGKFGKVGCHVTTHGYELSSAVDVSMYGDDYYDEYYDFVNDPEDRFTELNHEEPAQEEVETDVEEATRG